MKNGEGEHDLRNWLESDAGRTVLSAAAAMVLKETTLRRISLSALGFPDPVTEPRADLLAAIQAEIALLLLEDSAHIAERLKTQETNRGRILAGFFLKTFLDRLRSSPMRDPFRYLYKRTADILRETAGFFLKSRKNRRAQKAGTLYSLIAENREIGPLAEDVLNQIPLPGDNPDALRFDDVKKEKMLVRLAAYFWQQVSILFNDRPIWLEIRDFIHWMARFVPMKEHVMPSTDDIDADNREAHAPIPLAQVVCNSGYPSEFDPVLLRKWAAVFVERLTEKEQRIFFLRVVEGLSLKDVAAQTGFTSAGGPANRMALISEKLSTLVADLPWLSDDGPIEADNTARAFFLEALGEILKNRFALP